MNLRRTALVVALLNLAYFGVEFVVARRIGSVSLLADSADFLEDAAVNLLIVIALGWSVRARALVGMGLALLMVVPALAFLVMLWTKLSAPVPPDPVALTLVGTGALAVNLTCAILLARHRAAHGSLARAAFLSARNDVLANIAIIGAGVMTWGTASMWPDILIGLAIAWMNLDAAQEVWEAARKERDPTP